MSVSRFARSAALLLATLALVAGCSSGGRTVTVTHGAVTLQYVDLGATGASQGDERVTTIATAVDGSGAGRLDAVLTTTAIDTPNKGDEIRIGHLVFMVGADADQIVVDGTSVYPATSATIAQNTSTIRPIIGGSGKYAGATGWAESFHLADGTWKHVLHLGS